jgi:hypothetical protein
MLSFARYSLVVVFTTALVYLSTEGMARYLRIAPQFVPSFAVDERLQFLKDHRPGPEPVGVVIGASMATYNVDTDLLQEVEHRPFVNLGAYGLSIRDSWLLYRNFVADFPVREVIFAVQTYEFKNFYLDSSPVSPDLFHRYVLGEMGAAEESTYRDVFGLYYYLTNWRDLRTRNSYVSVAFSKTGSVPLTIDRKDVDPQRWAASNIFAGGCDHCMDDLAGMCREVRADGRPFALVLPPVRLDVLARRQDLRAMHEDRRVRISAVMRECGGVFFDVGESTAFDDSCFADFAHLNARGMDAMTGLLTRFRRGERVESESMVTCDVLARG